MITTKRVSLVVLTIASLCSLNANAMWQNPLNSLRALRQKRKKCLGAINGFAQRYNEFAQCYDKIKQNSTLKDQEENPTSTAITQLTAIAQECQSKTGYTSLDESYNPFSDRSKTWERVNAGVTVGTLGTVVASISASNSFGDLFVSILSLPVIAGAGVLVHGGLLTYSYINSSEKFGGSPRLRRQFVAQQYPYFGKAKEQSGEDK